MNFNDKLHKLNIVVGAALNYAAILGMVTVFLSAFEIPMMGGLHYLYWLAIALAGYVVFNYIGKKVKNIIIIVLVTVGILVGIIAGSFLYYSLLGLINGMKIGEEFENAIAPGLFLQYVFTVAAVFITYFVASGKKTAAVVISMLGLIPCIIFNRLPDSFSLMLLIVFVLTLSVWNRGQALYPAIVAAGVIVLYFLLILIVPGDDFKGLEVRSKIAGLFGVTEKVENNIAVGGSGLGKLGDVDEIKYGNIKMLTVTAGYSGNIYFKGAVGGVYENNSWKPLKKQSYNGYEQLFGINEYGVDAYNQQAKLFSIINNDESLIKQMFGSVDNYLSQVKQRKYFVKYENATDRGQWYMPYGNSYSVSAKSEPDGYPINCKNGYIEGEQYIYSGIDYDALKTFIDEYSGGNNAVDKYVQWEKQYREFVYGVYLEVPSDVKACFENYKNMAGNSIPSAENVTFLKDRLAYAGLVKEYLSDTCSYSLSPGRVPDGEDFICYFLKDSKKGYCTYFASTAVMLLRNVGIPARYVSGYSVDLSNGEEISQEIKRNVAGKAYNESYSGRTTEVYDDSAHAWVEIYMDGYGWIPLEFTPGYSNEEVDASGNVVKAPEESFEFETSNENKSETDAVPSLEDKDYDTLEEYLRNNKNVYMDLNIVFRILWKNFLEFLKALAIAVSIMAFLSVLVYIPSAVSSKKKEKLFRINKLNTAEEDAAQVKELFKYLDKLCRFLKIERTDSMSGADFVELMESKYDYFKEADVENVVYAIEKLSYGHGNIGMAEMKRVVEAMEYIHNASYRSLSLFKKLLYRFVWHLY